MVSVNFLKNFKKTFEEFKNHVYFPMEELKTIRKRFQHGLVCTVMNLKDTFLHVPMRHRVIVLLFSNSQISQIQSEKFFENYPD